MFGGLHIEMGLWKTLGDLLEGSGWTTNLYEADVASSGTADSFLKASHLTRTRHAHQITALSLVKLQHKARKCLESQESLSFEDWKKDHDQQKPYISFLEYYL